MNKQNFWYLLFLVYFYYFIPTRIALTEWEKHNMLCAFSYQRVTKWYERTSNVLWWELKSLKCFQGKTAQFLYFRVPAILYNDNKLYCNETCRVFSHEIISIYITLEVRDHSQNNSSFSTQKTLPFLRDIHTHTHTRSNIENVSIIVEFNHIMWNSQMMINVINQSQHGFQTCF